MMHFRLMVNIKFTIPGMPQGKARARTFYNPRLGRSVSTTPDKTVLYENLIKTRFWDEMGEGDVNTWTETKTPLTMQIRAFFPIPKSASKRDKDLMARGVMLPVKKPDADNIAKVICDALNGVAYADDTQVVRLSVIKAYTEGEPHVSVRISEI